jgi:hypothetical protein
MAGEATPMDMSKKSPAVGFALVGVNERRLSWLSAAARGCHFPSCPRRLPWVAFAAMVHGVNMQAVYRLWESIAAGSVRAAELPELIQVTWPQLSMCKSLSAYVRRYGEHSALQLVGVGEHPCPVSVDEAIKRGFEVRISTTGKLQNTMLQSSTETLWDMQQTWFEGTLMLRDMDFSDAHRHVQLLPLLSEFSPLASHHAKVQAFGIGFHRTRGVRGYLKVHLDLERREESEAAILAAGYEETEEGLCTKDPSRYVVWAGGTAYAYVGKLPNLIGAFPHFVLRSKQKRA